MVRRFGLVILVLVLSSTGAGVGAGTARADDAAPVAGPTIGPLAVVTSSVSRALASRRSPPPGLDTDEERRAGLRAASDDFFDVDGMARRALGPHWKGFARPQRDEFVGRFRGLLGESFVSIVDRYAGDHLVAMNEEVAGIFAQVRSRITPKQGAHLTIEYRLSQSGPRWTVYDVLVDGVSLVSIYRGRFNAILGTSSVAELLERMGAGPPGTPPTHRGPLAALLLLGAGSHARWGR